MDWIALGVLCAMGFVLGQFQNRARNQGAESLLTYAIRSALMPVAVPLGEAARSANQFVTGIGRTDDYAREVQRLRAERASWQLYEERILEMQARLDALRATIGMERFARSEPVAADAIAYFPRENRMMLNRGDAAGIEAGMAVVSGGALIGRIQTVEAGRAEVLLLISPAQTIGALVQHDDQSAAGLLRGENARRLILELVDARAAVEPGDLVMTSGFSDEIPYGIPIGRVASVADDPEFGRRRAFVTPAVDPSRIKEVLVFR